MQPPSDYKNSGIFMLISGILSGMACLGWIVGLIWICVGAFWVLPLVGAVFEIIVGAGVMSGKWNKNVKTVSIVGLISAILCGNVVGMILEILALLNYNKPDVAAFLAQGEMPPPAY
jgi:hypothetical protein